MKKSLIMLLVSALLLLNAIPAFAAGSNPSARNVMFTLAGTITAINGSTVTVEVAAGKPIVQPYIGQSLEIQTTDSTRFLLKTDTGVVAISLADLEVGQKVSVQGQAVNGLWTATRITVGASLIHR